MLYAGIGSRKLDEDEIRLCYLLGFRLAKLGAHLKTGSAQGADQAFANGALDGGGKVTLCLPWPSYEFKWVELAKARGANTQLLQYFNWEAWDSLNLHPRKDSLSKATMALHARNYLIIDGCQCVFAFPKQNQYGLGGTGQGIRIAEKKNISIIRLDNKEIQEKLLDSLTKEEYLV